MTEIDDRKAPALSLVQTNPTSPFDDLASLRLDAENETVGVKKLTMSVPVGTPEKQAFIRTHPDPGFQTDCVLLNLKSDREIYVVMPHVAIEIPGEWYRATLCTYINRQGAVGLWQVRLPDPEGRQMEWHRTAREAAAMAMSRWIRVVPNT